MPSWTCSECGRRFGRRGQGHECAPAMDLEEYFSTGPVWERPIFEAVNAHLASLGEVHVEPVSVGIFFKGGRTFAQLRPMARWVAMSLLLPRIADHRLVRRKVTEAGAGSWYHVLNVASVDDLDPAAFGLLTEAYLADQDRTAAGTSPP